MRAAAIFNNFFVFFFVNWNFIYSDKAAAESAELDGRTVIAQLALPRTFTDVDTKREGKSKINKNDRSNNRASNRLARSRANLFSLFRRAAGSGCHISVTQDYCTCLKKPDMLNKHH